MAGKIPKSNSIHWVQTILKDGDIKRIELAVADAEKQTDGEIVPMLVKSSTNTGSVRLLIALLLFIVFIFVEHEFDDLIFEDSYFYYLPISLIFFYWISGPLSQLTFLQKWLTAKNDQIHDVHLRAEVEFYRGRYHQTQKKSAILLFVSLMEKRAVVLTDQAIASKVPKETWDEVVKLITAHVSDDQFATGMTKAIQKSGQILAQYFPATSSVKNEVSNQFIIKN